VVDAIYQNVPGAKFYNDTSVGPIYALPCDQEIDLTFYFAGQPYPIHPLDTNLDGSQLGLVDDNGNSVCIGAVRVSSAPSVCPSTNLPSQFQPVSFDASFGSGEAPDFDMVLGMAWCMSLERLILSTHETFLHSAKRLFVCEYGGLH
jgi:hypothetical protein